MAKTKKKLEMRRVFVLREVEIEFSELRPGHVFRTAKTGKNDPVNERAYNLATGVVYTSPEGNYGIECESVVIVQNKLPATRFNHNVLKPRIGKKDRP